MIGRLRYPVSFALVVVALTAGALAAYGRISGAFLILTTPPGPTAADSSSRAPAQRYAPASAADYERFADEDSVWRERNARAYTLAEIRARGDGRRSPRQAMQDRVFRHTREGERGAAISELERWVASNPRDEAALLSLARLLAQAGRTDASVARYRQVISLQERGRR